MTRNEAILIRAQQLQGATVDQTQVAEAIEVIKATNAPLSESKVNEIRKKQGKDERPKKPPQPKPKRLVVPAFTKEDPAAVVKALKPWALPSEVGHPVDPESYVWPFPGEGVDMDAIHRKGERAE